MKRGILYGVVVAILLAGAATAYAPIRQRVRTVAANLKIINADTGDVMYTATYQRFAVRREAVASMKGDLLSLAAAESAFVADSGRPTTNPPRSYWSSKDRDNYAWIRIERDRWVAKMTNLHTSMSCSITAMVDTMTMVDTMPWRYHAGQPVCAGWSAESTALANAPGPINPAPEPNPQSPAEPLRAPRHHRDWGPVNNTPPPIPYVVKDACEGEGCDTRGVWAACSTLVVRSDKRPDAPMVFTIAPQEKFTAVTADVHVVVPGMVVFRDTISNRANEGGDPVDSIRFIPADTLYILNYIGEGYLVWWYRGQAARGYQFWGDEHYHGPDFPEDVVAIRSAKSVWWVRVRNTAGKEGWMVGDPYKFATGGYMDEIERCLHTAKG